MASRDDLYEEAVRTFGSALDRLARAYGADSESRRDLLQEIHFALWRSVEQYDARCSLRTWIYRIAHNVATSHVAHDHRSKSKQLKRSRSRMGMAAPMQLQAVTWPSNVFWR